jgi:hypothetical protein
LFWSASATATDAKPQTLQAILNPFMFRLILTFGCSLIFTLFLSCKKEKLDSKLDYNQKANELIQQVILEDPCECILEIPKESLIKIYLADNPKYDVRKKAIEELHLKNGKELDSIENLSLNFILDTTFFKKRNIKVIERESLRERIKDTSIFKECRIGITSISRPIFDKSYTTALVYSTLVFTCVGTYPEVYIYEKGKWKRKYKNCL